MFAPLVMHKKWGGLEVEIHLRDTKKKEKT